MPRKSKVQEIVEGTTDESRATDAANAVTIPEVVAEPPVVEEPTHQVPEETTEETEETPKRVPLKDRLGELDENEIDELLRLSDVQERLDKAARERADALTRAENDRIAREEQDRKNQEDLEYLRKLRKTDPVKYNEELDRREALEEAQKQEVKRLRAITDEFTKRLTTYVDGHVDKQVADKFRGKDYSKIGGRDVDLLDGVIAYIDDLIQTERSTMKTALEKELVPIIKKKLLTEINGTEETTPQPTTGSGVRPRQANKVNLDSFQTESELAEAFATNKITKEEMVAWYRAHGIGHSRY